MIGSDKPLSFSYTKGSNAPVVYHYVLNLQGDVVRLVTDDGITVATYAYDAWGNIIDMDYTYKAVADANPLRYRGYYYDSETGLYYLQSRYYNPQWGRFINADRYASTGQGLLGNNMFAYCGNNPTMYTDASGTRRVYVSAQYGGFSYNSADRAIVNNADIICKVAQEYGVDPCIVAGCIYIEQSTNYDLVDRLTDVPLFFFDTSVGVGQVKISTARFLAENGYIDQYRNSLTTDYQIARKLQIDTLFNITCVAAYLAYFQQSWMQTYDISSKPEILGTLYNKGPTTPHTAPGANAFGQRVKTCQWYMEILLY